MRDIDENAFLEALKNGVARTTNLIAKATDYHGGPVMTEYLLTADIAREFIEQDYPVTVECHNRMFVTAITRLKAAQPRKRLRSKRTDVAVIDAGLIPLALIEVKIRVKKLRAIKGDLDKITTTMSLLKANCAAKVIGAVVFQVHIAGTKNRTYAAEFKAAVEKVEKRLHAELALYAPSRPDFRFTMHPLQSDDGGIVEREIEGFGDEAAWGAHGHATRYHVIIIRSTRPVPPSTGPFEDLRRQSNE
jgi:hypothetical protein